MSEVDWRIGHLDHLGSPFGNAGGVIKKIEDVEKMAKAGVGWMEAGTHTLEERPGNQKVDPETGEANIVYYHDPETGLTWNSLGMPNQGVDKLEEEIPHMNEIAKAHGKKIIYNVAPVTDNPVEESQELVQRVFDAGAEAVLLNAGCPNVVVGDGERHAILCHDPRMFGLVLRRLVDIGVGSKYPKIFVRTSPYSSYDIAKTAYRNIEVSNAVSAVWTPNSWGGLRPPEDENGKLRLQVPGDVAGKTGPGTADDAAWQTELAIQILNGSGIDVVSSGGIANSEVLNRRAAKQLKRVLNLGAVAGAGTTFFYEIENGWKYDVDKMLHEFDAQG